MTVIDLSRVPMPAAIEPLDYDTLFDQFAERFVAFWNEARAQDPSLPVYDLAGLDHDPAMMVGQAWAYLRYLDRTRVNDAISALLAPRAVGADLDNVVARQNILRLIVVPATANSPAVMETDAQLLRRYLLSFDRASAGSRQRYLFEAWSAWPAMRDARVNGHAVHGRRGDVDLVIIGPDGRLPTDAERDVVRLAVQAPDVQPEAVALVVLDAVPREYQTHLVIEVPQGPDTEVLRTDVVRRVERAANARMLIGGEVPSGYLAGAAYGKNIIRVRDLAPVTIDPDPYAVPVQTDLTIDVEVRP